MALLNQIRKRGASLVARWLRICLPMQETRVWALVQEDPTCRGATKPEHHNYWGRALEPASHNYWTREATAMRSPVTAMKSSPQSPQLEKACAQQRRPNTAKNIFKKKKKIGKREWLKKKIRDLPWDNVSWESHFPKCVPNNYVWNCIL